MYVILKNAYKLIRTARYMAPRFTGVPESVSKCRLARGDLFPSEDFDFQTIIAHAAVTPRMSKHDPNAPPVSQIALKRPGNMLFLSPSNGPMIRPRG